MKRYIQNEVEYQKSKDGMRRETDWVIPAKASSKANSSILFELVADFDRLLLLVVVVLRARRLRSANALQNHSKA